MANSPMPICGEPMDYPQPLCTREPGHDGMHATEMIPEPLAAVVADTLRTLDDLETQRHAVHELGHRLRERLRLNRILAAVLLALGVLNAVVAIWALVR